MTTQREVIALYEARGIHPGRAPEADPGLEKARRGRRKWILGSAGLWRPRGSRPGLIGRGASSRLDHRSSGPSAGLPLSG